MRILVVDDEPLVAGVIADGLRDEGYAEILIANSGPEGLEVIERDRPDVVFLDITMPGMDGIEVLRRIRERSPDLPVVILSGWASPQQLEAARKLGVIDVLHKPAPLKHLSKTLARIEQIAGETPHYLLIVSRTHPGVFKNLSRKFAGDTAFQLILDRRQGERRRWGEPHEAERRRAERRLPAADLLRLQGIAIVRPRQKPFARPK